jgi:hypothetical protein
MRAKNVLRVNNSPLQNTNFTKYYFVMIHLLGCTGENYKEPYSGQSVPWSTVLWKTLRLGVWGGIFRAPCDDDNINRREKSCKIC